MCMLQTLIRRKPVQYRLVSLFEACRNNLSQSPPPAPAPKTCPLPAAGAASASASGSGSGSLKRYENSCLDLYYNVIPQKPVTFVHLNGLLPLAWSHNPLTSLKIISSYREQSRVCQEDAFSRAVHWLHHNHPKTLAFNLPYLAGHVHYITFTDILYWVLGLKRVNSFGDHERAHFQEAINGLPDFRFLHDRISDFFAESLKFDIQNLNNHDHDDEDEILEVTDAVEDIEKAPFVLESVAERIFPGVENALERLRKEVLEPLNKVLDYTDRDDMNPWGYRLVHEDRPSQFHRVKKYFNGVKESSDKMVVDALLPNEILCFVRFQDFRQVAELQWKIMLESYKERMRGILSHSLAVIHPNKYLFNNYVMASALAMSLTILMSELSVEEAWKGKFIPLIPNPRLLLIQGDDLKSKLDFLREGVVKDDEDYRGTDFKKVFDLILQEAVDRSLKPEQMIRRVYVFTVSDNQCFESISRGTWEGEQWRAQDYEEMQSKYKDHGYDMPHIVFWKIGDHLEHVQDSPDERGIVTISGFRKTDLLPAYANFLKMFLENDGEMSPQHVMEANLSHQDSPLAVLD